MTYTVNPAQILMFSKRNKCLHCKHRFDKPYILAVDKPKRGKLQPKYNSEILFHVQETHGIPADIERDWILGSIYGAKLILFGAKW